MADYIVDPIQTDEDELQEDAFDQLQVKWPNWVPREHLLEVWMIAIGAHMVAEARDTGSDVPPAIFQYFGEKIAQVEPIAETFAVVNSTWTFLTNPAGRTIEAGTGIVLEDGDGDTHLFEVVLDVTIASPALTTAAGQVQLRAVEGGSGASGIGSPGTIAEPVESPDWLDTITLSGPTSGGADAEDPFDYRDRLTTRFTLLTPRPILASDFGVLAQDEALQRGYTARVAVRDNWLPGTNKKYTVSHNGTGGTLSLQINPGSGAVGFTPVAWNASAATIKAAIEGLTSVVDVGDVAVTGGPWPAAVTIEFTGALGMSNVPTVAAGANSLTPGGSVPTITNTVVGVVPTTNAEKAIAIGMMDADTGADLPSNVLAEIDAVLEELREVNFIVNLYNPTRNTVSVNLVGVARSGSDPAQVDADVTAALTDFLQPQNFGKSQGSDADDWVYTTTLRQQDLSRIAKNVAGFSHWTTLTFDIGDVGDPLDALDKTIGGVFPVTTPGSITVAIT